MLVAFIKWNEGPAREPYCVRHSTIGRLGVTLVLAVAVGLTGRVAAQSGNAEARDLVSYWVGQGVGLVEHVQSATSVVQDFKMEFAEAVTNLLGALE